MPTSVNVDGNIQTTHAWGASSGGNARIDKSAPPGCERDSEISDTLDILAGPWRFLIIREAFFGAQRFNEFAASLGIPRATLSKSLDTLVRAEVLESRSFSRGPGTWKRYVLSESGRDLFSALLGLMWYGDKWLWDGTPPLALYHRRLRLWFSPRLVWEHDRSPVDPWSVRFEVDADYWRPRQGSAARSHRVDRQDQARGWRPCSMERTLALVGDRWTFMIFQEFFHANSRFEEFSRNLGIASNILSARLDNLASNGFICKQASSNGAYRLTPKGLDIYAPMVLLKSWGDRWLRLERPATSRFVAKSTGRPTRAIVVVPGTGEGVLFEDVELVTNYGHVNRH